MSLRLQYGAFHATVNVRKRRERREESAGKAEARSIVKRQAKPATNAGSTVK